MNDSIRSAHKGRLAAVGRGALALTLGILTPPSAPAASAAPSFSSDEVSQLCGGNTVGKDGDKYKATACDYVAQSDPALFMRWRAVPDTRVSACEQQSSQTENRYGESVTNSESWTVGGSAGVDVRSWLQLGFESSYAKTEERSKSEHKTVVANAGQTNLATVGQPMVKEQGTVTLTLQAEQQIPLMTGGTSPIWNDAGTATIDVTREAPDDHRQRESGRAETPCGQTNRVPEDSDQWWDDYG